MRTPVFCLLWTIAGCISAPVFEQASPNDNMVLVPGTMLSELSTQKDGKGGDDDDSAPAPKTPAPKTPAPGASTPSTGAPSTGAAPPPTNFIPSFWVDARQVSRGEMDACVASGVCTAPACATAANEPAVCVTRAQAEAFCAGRAKRLVRVNEWTALAMAKPAGVEALSGGVAEWVSANSGVVRGGTADDASRTVPVDSVEPRIGFRCARDR